MTGSENDRLNVLSKLCYSLVVSQGLRILFFILSWSFKFWLSYLCLEWEGKWEKKRRRKR